MSKENNYNKTMFKDDNRGVTYVEMLVALALLSGVLLVAYTFISYSYKSMIFTQSKYNITQEARNAMIGIGDNIRKSKGITNPSLHNPVEIKDSGYQINVYVDDDNDGDIEVVTYKLLDQKLLKGKAEVGSTPTSWHTLINNVHNRESGINEPIFKLDGSTVSIKLHVKDPSSRNSTPVVISGSYTIRSKG